MRVRARLPSGICGPGEKTGVSKEGATLRACEGKIGNAVFKAERALG
jgi:hypothetical protein